MTTTTMMTMNDGYDDDDTAIEGRSAEMTPVTTLSTTTSLQIKVQIISDGEQPLLHAHPSKILPLLLASEAGRLSSSSNALT